MLIAAAFTIGGAIGLELIGGRYWALHGSDNLPYRMMQNVEESMEMSGLIILIYRIAEIYI